MDHEYGIVREVDKTRILVEAEPGSGCACCAAKDGCVVRDDKRKRSLWMENSMGAEPGDRVTFYIEERGMVLASVILYLFPVIFLFGGIIVGSFLYIRMGMERDIAAIILGLAGVVLSFLVARLISPRISASNMVQPVLTGVEKTQDV